MPKWIKPTLTGILWFLVFCRSNILDGQEFTMILWSLTANILIVLIWAPTVFRKNEKTNHLIAKFVFGAAVVLSLLAIAFLKSTYQYQTEFNQRHDEIQKRMQQDGIK